MIKLEIDQGQIRTVIDSFNLDKADMDKACKMALSRTATYIISKIVKEISKTTGMPQKLVKARIGKFIKTTLSVKIWNGLNPIKLIRFLTTEKMQSKSFQRYLSGKGVKVGKYEVYGAFFAFGGTRIVQRTGKERFPIKNVTVEIAIDESKIIDAVIESEYADRLYTELQRACRWQIVRKS